MDNELAIARYRRWYRRLLRYYSRSHRDRFAESMEQTFHDLCRERVQTNQRLGNFVLWVFAETSLGIIKENAMSLLMHANFVRIALVVGLILLIPLFGNQFVDGCNWGLFDFVFAGAILFGAALTYDLLARHGGTTAYRAAVAIACATGLILVWINAAVGMIGDEELANAMYLGVLAVAFNGAWLARLKPRGMSRALVATAVAQAAVPLLALTWVPAQSFAPGILPVLGLNSVFVAAWLASALLFRQAAGPRAPHQLASPG